MRRFFAVLTLAGVSAGMAQTPATQPAAKPRVARAVIVSGLSGSKAYARNLLDWTQRFGQVLTGKCGLKAEDIFVLTEKADPKATPPRQESTLKNFRAAMGRMRGLLGPNDQFVLVMLGHGQINEPDGKLCLTGEDLRADELATLLDALPTGRIVLINAASGGAEFVKTCTGTGRVLITGAGAEDDGNQAYFAEFFLAGYESGQADTNKDKTIDLMEAYAHAARATANFYHRQYLVNAGRQRSESEALVWYVRGKNTRAVWRKLYAGTNNQLGMPRPQPGQPAPPDPEAEPDKPPRFGPFGPEWHNRRVLAEHARLDDNAGMRGFYLWQPYEFVKLPKDEPGQSGFLARRIALGKPDLLKRPPGK